MADKFIREYAGGAEEVFNEMKAKAIELKAQFDTDETEEYIITLVFSKRKGKVEGQGTHAAEGEVSGSKR